MPTKSRRRDHVLGGRMVVRAVTTRYAVNSPMSIVARIPDFGCGRDASTAAIPAPVSAITSIR
jgi:hypothetical protein